MAKTERDVDLGACGICCCFSLYASIALNTPGHPHQPPPILLRHYLPTQEVTSKIAKMGLVKRHHVL